MTRATARTVQRQAHSAGERHVTELERVQLAVA